MSFGDFNEEEKTKEILNLYESENIKNKTPRFSKNTEE